MRSVVGSPGGRGVGAAELDRPTLEELQRIEPKRVELDRFPASRRDDQVSDLRIHPGELISVGALGQQTVAGVDSNSKIGAPEMPSGDVFEHRQQEAKRVLIAAEGEVPIDGVEEPEGGVGGVVEAEIVALREHVRNEPVMDIASERSKDKTGLREATGGQGQPFEADHRVAPPIGEPVIAGDDRPHLVAGGPGPGRVFDAARRLNDERVGREDAARRAGPVRAAGSAASKSRRRRSPSAVAEASGDTASIDAQASVEATSVTGEPCSRSSVKRPGLQRSPLAS